MLAISAWREAGRSAAAFHLMVGFHLLVAPTSLERLDANWGCLIMGRSGATADVALQDNAGNVTLTVKANKVYVGGAYAASYLFQLGSDSADQAVNEHLDSGIGQWLKARSSTSLPTLSRGSPSLLGTRRHNGLGGTRKGDRFYGVLAQEALRHYPKSVQPFNAKLNPDDEFDTANLGWNMHEVNVDTARSIPLLQAQIDALKAELAAHGIN